MGKSKRKSSNGDSQGLTLRFGHQELVIHKRYQTLSIINDFLIAVWFLAGSICFLYPWLQDPAVWMFIIGSGQFMIRPSLRLAHQFHLKKMPAGGWEM